MAKIQIRKNKEQSFEPDRGPVVSPRFAAALLLIVVGIAWVIYYRTGVQVAGDIRDGKVLEAQGPKFFRDLGNWNYAIGFGLMYLGLIVSAHPSTPLGRGRGVVAGMLGCFIVGLVWICTYYAISQDVSALPVFDDLEQKNLIVGIGFMAVGFTFATRWE